MVSAVDWGVDVVVISHPEVTVDPAVPVTQWGLSPAGRARAVRLLAMPWAATLTRVASSGEVKAVQTAQVLAGPLRLSVDVDDHLGENDRSATGYLPPSEFEALADEFFARPHDSVRGWEPAVDAQRRIVAAVTRAVVGAVGDVAVVTHGGVGTLLLCHLLGVSIDRRHDQSGQGSWYRFDHDTGEVAHGWTRLE